MDGRGDADRVGAPEKTNVTKDVGCGFGCLFLPVGTGGGGREGRSH